MIRIQDIAFGYGAEPVLDGVSMRLEKGEFVGVVGPNGSGKTTLLKAMTKVVRPNRGELQILDKQISHLSNRELARNIAVVPQDTGVMFAYTVAEIVLMGRSPYHSALSFDNKDDLVAAQKAMETMDVAHLAQRLLSEISGGERQRVIIARALAQDTPIMLLDEPTAFLDLKHQVGIYGVLRRLNREKSMTIIVVSHSLGLAAQFCKRIVMLKDGRVAADGPVREVMTKANIERVFEVDVRVDYDEKTGTPLIFPIAQE